MTASNIRRLRVAGWVSSASLLIYIYAFRRDLIQTGMIEAVSASLIFGYALYLLLGCIRGFTITRYPGTRPPFGESYEISDTLTPVAAVSDLPIAILSGFVASYENTLLASGVGVWANSSQYGRDRRPSARRAHPPHVVDRQPSGCNRHVRTRSLCLLSAVTCPAANKVRRS